MRFERRPAYTFFGLIASPEPFSLLGQNPSALIPRALTSAAIPYQSIVEASNDHMFLPYITSFRTGIQIPELCIIIEERYNVIQA
jgi:hypothetical protein